MATKAANAVPNVAVAISVQQVTATSTTLTMESFDAMLSLKGLAQAGSEALNLGLEALEAPKPSVDITGAGFAAAICGIIR
jgi:hypothetical protein